MTSLRSRLTSLVDPSIRKFTCKACFYSAAPIYHCYTNGKLLLLLQLILSPADESKLKAVQEVSENLEVRVY